ncbi:hypothetical protein EG352_15085 [Chryseobacterium indologenes]|uniref:TIGR04222 domain-containing membrane protein n=1 Tax=Chryseobacterium indologenes TaxID=253 RepID=A0AAD0YXA8_CHRID|nr:hypothetical protein [Chryseobacterium indologenes]AZB19010.1 hypothetical protein EG352_15085 [Chryseobacterium indologenes]
METKLVLKDEFLWNRILGFSLDAPDADFPFSKKLAKEENWTAEFTKTAIEEYKKFVYLCCILPHGASPSKIVDKVWHMHLIYTQNYWEDFCPNILKRPLHHHPSKGGKSEKTKHSSWFSDTLKNYQTVFQSEAPQEIWLQPEKSGTTNKWWRKLGIIPLFSALMTLSSCLGEVLTTLFGILVSIVGIFLIAIVISLFQAGNSEHNDDKSSGGGCSGGGSSCGGGGCGGGCGGCGGCGG